MNRYLVERSFPNGFPVTSGAEGRTTCASIVAVDAPFGVRWIRSYVSLDGRRTFCLYEAPSEQAIREVAERNALPVDRITAVARFDPQPGIA